MQSARHFCPEVSDIKFHENPSSERRVDNKTKVVGAFRECTNVPNVR